MKKIIIIIAIVIIGAAVYYVVSNNNTKTNNAPLTTNQTPSAKTPIVDSTNNSSDVTISIKNFSFSPAEQTVKTGTKVTWVNEDSAAHTITSDNNNPLDSKTLAPGESFSFVFASPGVRNYHCAIHPSMKGSIMVKD